MCDRSNRPTALRTVRCSSMIEAYWTGISQPANGTIRAPSATCAACSGVRSRAGRLGHWLVARAEAERSPARSRQRAAQRVLDHGSLGGMGHQLQRLIGREPADLVELVVVVRQVAADGAHQEEVDRLVEARPAADEEVADVADRLLDLDPQAGLLARLAQRRLLQGLAGVGRALGKRPQRRMAAMDEGDLECDRRSDRWTTPPADVARALRRAATARLRAASALEPERQSGASGLDPTGGADRGEAEATGRDRSGGHVGAARRATTGPVIDRWRARPTRGCRRRERARPRAEVDRGVGDEAGRETHSHGWHCTPRRRPAQAFAARPWCSLSRRPSSSAVERHHLVDARRATSKRSAPSRACRWPCAAPTPGRRPASRWRLPGCVAAASGRRIGRDDHAHRLRRAPSRPRRARPARPPAGRPPAPRPAPGPASRSARRTRRGPRRRPRTAPPAAACRPGSATRPARSGAAARAAIASATGHRRSAPAAAAGRGSPRPRSLHQQRPRSSPPPAGQGWPRSPRRAASRAPRAGRAA